LTVSDDDHLSILFRCDTLGQTYAQVALTLGTTRNAVGGVVKRLRDAAPLVKAARLDDGQFQLVLSRMFCSRHTAEAIAKDFARLGKPMTRHAVLYLVWWVMNDLHCAGEDAGEVGGTDPVAWPAWWRPATSVGVAA
jgi:hypothetical protein